MKKYLVAGSKEVEIQTEDKCIINANNIEEAKKIYITRVGVYEECFGDYVYDPAFNAGFAENMYVDKRGRSLFDEKCESSYSDEMVWKFVNKNVKNLFKENEEWCKLYIEFLKNYDEDKEYKFPVEMLEVIYMSSWGSSIVCYEIGKDIKEF